MNKVIQLGFILMITSSLLGACGQQLVEIPEVLPKVTIGVVGPIQPMGTTDLLAGYIPEDRGFATEENLIELRSLIIDTLRAQTKREYEFIPAADGADPTITRMAGVNSALEYWVAVGKQLGVEVLIIPYVLSWHPREGSSAGVTSSAELTIDFFLIDTKGEGALLGRSHYSEKQVGLASNLLTLNKFIKRGGKWVTTEELAKEAIEKMIKEFRL